MPSQRVYRPLVLAWISGILITLSIFPARSEAQQEEARYVPSFAPPDGFVEETVPGFGEEMIPLEAIWDEKQIKIMESKYLERYDRNKDGFLDSRELRYASWGSDAIDADDLNGDGRLSRFELMTRTARRYRWEAKANINDPRAPRKIVKVDPLLRRFDSKFVSNADSILKRYDTNKNNVLDQDEVKKVPWKSDPRRDDENRDGRLSRSELVSRMARMTEEDEREKRTSNSSSGKASRGTWDLAATLISRYDVNKDRELEAAEWTKMGVSTAPGDSSRDGRVTREELAVWLQSQQAETDEEEIQPPEWFGLLDHNEDGQVQMAEYATEWTDEKIAEFQRYDLNEDGLITSDECIAVDGDARGKYASEEMVVIGTRSSVMSTIEVEDDIIIKDLNIQLSITHTYDSHLDVFLIGPEGEEIELFTKVGEHDDNFDNTVLDDEAETSITRGRPPFQGTYRPEAVDKRQASLRIFNGKSAKGVWQLFINAERSDRPGALNRWSLIIDSAGEPVKVKAPLSFGTDP